MFRFSAWKYVEERGQFYYHAFTPEQPDLNYRNPLVVEEMLVSSNVALSHLTLPRAANLYICSDDFRGFCCFIVGFGRPP